MTYIHISAGTFMVASLESNRGHFDSYFWSLSLPLSNKGASVHVREDGVGVEWAEEEVEGCVDLGCGSGCESDNGKYPNDGGDKTRINWNDQDSGHRFVCAGNGIISFTQKIDQSCSEENVLGWVDAMHGIGSPSDRDEVLDGR